MSQVTLRRSISHIGLLQIAIIVLTIVTALIHLQKGLGMGSFAPHSGGPPPGGHFGGARPGGSGGGGPSIMSMLPLPLSTLFFLDAAAYIVLLIALYLPALKNFQRIIRWLLIALAVLTIVAFFLIAGTRFTLQSYIDKPVEIALIVLLLIEDRQVARLKTVG